MKEVTKILILVCSIVGFLLIMIGLALLTGGEVLSQIFGFSVLGIGCLMIIYGFNPETAKDVIRAIKELVSTLFQR